jgi:hypothetical protein
MVHEVLHDFEAMPINPSKHLLRHGDYSRKLLLRVPGRLGLGHGAETGCEGGLPGDDFHNLQAEGDDEAVHDVIQKGGA